MIIDEINGSKEMTHWKCAVHGTYPVLCLRFWWCLSSRVSIMRWALIHKINFTYYWHKLKHVCKRVRENILLVCRLPQDPAHSRTDQSPIRTKQNYNRILLETKSFHYPTCLHLLKCEHCPKFVVSLLTVTVIDPNWWIWSFSSSFFRFLCQKVSSYNLNVWRGH